MTTVSPARFRHLAADRQELERQGLWREQRVVRQRDGARIRLDGGWLINFCSNDYLGLADHPQIIRSMQEAAGAYGAGSSASPLVCGRTELHERLETTLAQLTGRERVLLLSCGYMANLAIQSALVNRRDITVIEDRLCHASIIDAAQLSRARFRRYRHVDHASLQKVLEETGGRPALVVTESVFSMDGDIAPLPDIAALCHQHDACLLVDDAHGFGVLGRHGLGAMDHFSLSEAEVPLLMATFGKAAGVYGAFVAGPAELIETLVQRARPYIYSTALPPPVVAAAATAIDIIHQEGGRRERLTALIARFRAGAQELELRLLPSQTPIQPLIIGDAAEAVRLSQQLEREGYFVSAIRPPTVPRHSSRLRITITANHTEQHIDGLLDGLRRHVAATGRQR